MKEGRMTHYNVEPLTCPQCGKVHDLKKYTRINVTEKKGLKQDLIQNRLFQFYCDACQLSAPLAYECLYVDSKNKLAIALSPGQNREYEIELVEYAQRELEGFQLRMVDNINDLKEKIMIADNGMDDRVIEVMKLQCASTLKEEMKDDNLQDILFDYNTKREYFFMLIFEQKGIGRLPWKFDLYRQTQNQYSDKIKAHSSRAFMKVDIEWAGRLMVRRN